MKSILGQHTGGTALMNTAEALRLLKLIGACPWRDNVQPRDAAFITDMAHKAGEYGARLQVTGRQLFWLREIKDRLIEKGVL